MWRMEKMPCKMTCFCLCRKHPLLVAVAVILVIFRCSSSAAAQGGRVTCEVSSAKPMTNTAVKCHFPENVSQTRRNFFVSFYKGGRKEDAVEVLECSWLSGKMTCFVWPGYKYNQKISHETILEIPRASKEQAGTYSCYLSNMNPVHIQPCEFKLAGTTRCEIPSVKPMSDTSLTCYYPEDIATTRTDFAVSHYSKQGLSDEVLSCRWKKDNLFCDEVIGYLFNYKVTDRLTLQILNVTEEYEGTYSCQINSVSSDLCSFKMKKEEITSSCEVPSVQETNTTTFTCRFSVDVNVTRKSFKVIHLAEESNKGSNIVACVWMEDQLDCTTALGYEFNNVVTNHLLITVPFVTNDHKGTYVCQVLDAHFDGFSTCEFVVTEGRYTPEINSRNSAGICSVVGSTHYQLKVESQMHNFKD